jgi:hypothetical protein
VADRRSHARHDRFAISAALGGGSLPGTVATCPACGALHADLLAIRDAVRCAWLPTLPRELRLPAVTAERLRPSGWRGFVRAIGSSRDAVTRPLAMSLVGLGLAGLLLTALPTASFSFGSAGAMRQESSTTGDPAPAAGAIGITGQATTPSTGDVDRGLASTNASAPGDERLLALSAVLLASGSTLLIVRRLAAPQVTMR